MFSGNNPMAIKKILVKIKKNKLIRLNFILSINRNNPMTKTRVINPPPINPKLNKVAVIPETTPKSLKAFNSQSNNS